MTRDRILARVGVVVGTSAAAFALVGASVTADASTIHFRNPTSCTNQGCNFLDPQATGCGRDARSIRTAPIVSQGKTVGWVDLRWSPTCGNNWARVRSASGVQHLAATATRSDGAKRSNAGTGTALWTSMVFGRDLCVVATGWIGSARASTSCG